MAKSEPVEGPANTKEQPPGRRDYPKVLEEFEDDLLAKRREAAKGNRGQQLAGEHRVGVALSGGGIRSATFALGFFQALAKASLVRRIDYLSTVSGGGYFGGFLGALYRRDHVTSPGDVEKILESDDDPAIRYLRENGRYLAPAGTDDLLLAAAVLARNWAALQIVILTLLLFVFLLLKSVTMAVGLPSVEIATHLLRLEYRFAEQAIWLSPWLPLAACIFLVVAVPLGASYWTIERHLVFPCLPAALVWILSKVWMLLPYAVVAGGGAWLVLEGGHPLIGSALVVFAALALASVVTARFFRAWAPAVPFVLLFLVALSNVLMLGMDAPLGDRLPAAGVAGAILTLVAVVVMPGRPHGLASAERDVEARHAVSAALRTAMVFTVVVAVVGLVDTVAGSLYWALMTDRLSEATAIWTGGTLFSVLSGGAMIARRVAVAFGGQADGARLAVPVGVIAKVAGLAVVAVVLVGVDLGAHAITHVGKPPPGAPLMSAPEKVTTTLVEAAEAPGSQVDLVVTAASAPTVVVGPARRTPKDLIPPLIGTAITFLMSFLFGSSRVFLNRSTHHALYSSRLVRTYLGASNRKRFDPPPKEERSRAGDDGEPARDAATRVMAGDDIGAAEYWEWPTRPVPPRKDKSAPAKKTCVYDKGAPLHLVNVTINETVDGRSRTQQDDRRGLILALGPHGLSAGVQHHVVLGTDVNAPPLPFGGDGYQVFQLREGAKAGDFPEERMTLGEWLGISGAAFSTGLGSRTNIGLSILAGMANVRLGYWWRPGVARKFGIHRLGALFWVQTYLWRELLARFPGTANKLWYVSDGGHFENLGAYELIRRRVDTIIVVDAEADPDARFEGLANLVRKARLDFGADIEFVTDPAPLWKNQYLGPLEHLRRGKWDDGGDAPTLETPDQTGDSRAHAALARITYRGEPGDDPREGWLLYVKPTLVADEAHDVRHYHVEHPSFPHESTVDQFFGEDQWESYRKLGETVGGRLFPVEDEGNLKELFGVRTT